MNQRVKALGKQFVNFGDHATQLGAVKMTLHHVDQILNQQVSLHLHDRSRIGAHKKHQKIIA
jgi:hypothetical protein